MAGSSRSCASLRKRKRHTWPMRRTAIFLPVRSWPSSCCWVPLRLPDPSSPCAKRARVAGTSPSSTRTASSSQPDVSPSASAVTPRQPAASCSASQHPLPTTPLDREPIAWHKKGNPAGGHPSGLERFEANKTKPSASKQNPIPGLRKTRVPTGPAKAGRSGRQRNLVGAAPSLGLNKQPPCHAC
jgi:hypothetical protein